MDIRTRQEALAMGESRYFTGIPCKHGHVAERLTNARVCVICHAAAGARTFARRYREDADYAAEHNARAKAWKQANPAQKERTARQWRQQNPENVKAYRRRWYAKNKAKIKATNDDRRRRLPDYLRDQIKAWRKQNPRRADIHRRTSKVNRRARELQNGGKATSNEIAALFRGQNGCCKACGAAAKLQIDHVIAVANGGRSDISNLQLLCFPCNRSKGKKDMAMWMKERHGVST